MKYVLSLLAFFFAGTAIADSYQKDLSCAIGFFSPNQKMILDGGTGEDQQFTVFLPSAVYKCEPTFNKYSLNEMERKNLKHEDIIYYFDLPGMEKPLVAAQNLKFDTLFGSEFDFYSAELLEKVDDKAVVLQPKCHRVPQEKARDVLIGKVEKVVFAELKALKETEIDTIEGRLAMAKELGTSDAEKDARKDILKDVLDSREVMGRRFARLHNDIQTHCGKIPELTKLLPEIELSAKSHRKAGQAEKMLKVSNGAN